MGEFDFRPCRLNSTGSAPASPDRGRRGYRPPGARPCPAFLRSAWVELTPNPTARGQLRRSCTSPTSSRGGRPRPPELVEDVIRAKSLGALQGFHDGVMDRPCGPPRPRPEFARICTRSAPGLARSEGGVTSVPGAGCRPSSPGSSPPGRLSSGPPAEDHGGTPVRRPRQLTGHLLAPSIRLEGCCSFSPGKSSFGGIQLPGTG